MYAIIEMGGMQWKVSKSTTLRVPKMTVESGKTIEIDKVLLYVNEDQVDIGHPLLNNVKVKATVVSHGKAKKVKVFKKKRRKDYKVLKGHRQDYTEVRIDDIDVVKVTKSKAAQDKAKPAKVEKASKPGIKKATSTDKPATKKTARTAQPTPKKSTAATTAKVKTESASAKENKKEDDHGT